MYLTNASISALFRRIELFAALSGLFFAHNSLKINCFHHWDGLYSNNTFVAHRRGTIFRKQRHLFGSFPALFENFDALAPRFVLAIVDLSKVEDLSLDHPPWEERRSTLQAVLPTHLYC